MWIGSGSVKYELMKRPAWTLTIAMPKTKTLKAIHFLQQYYKLFYPLSNKNALMVQRRHFFNNQPLVKNVEFGFSKDGKLVIMHNKANDKEVNDEVTKHIRLLEIFIEALLSN